MFSRSLNVFEYIYHYEDLIYLVPIDRVESRTLNILLESRKLFMYSSIKQSMRCTCVAPVITIVISTYSIGIIAKVLL